VLWQELGYAGDILDAPGRRSIRPRWNSRDRDDDAGERQAARQRGGAEGCRQGRHRSRRTGQRSVQKFIEGTPKKVIVVPGKLVNIVV
jgi:leucyl-tRNA synthetase